MLTRSLITSSYSESSEAYDCAEVKPQCTLINFLLILSGITHNTDVGL